MAQLDGSKIKAETYSSLGGLNNKASAYATGLYEFLGLANMDFQVPGDLTQRWGSTQYFGQTFPGQINALYEFALLNGNSYIVSSYSGGIFYGATTGNNQGLSLSLNGSTIQLAYYVAAPVANGGTITPVLQSAAAIPLFGNQSELIGANGFSTPIVAQNFFVNPFQQYDNTLSCQTFVNYLFMADGNKYCKFDGTTTTLVGLPPILEAQGWSNSGAGPITGESLYFSNLSGASDFLGFGITGTYFIYGSYVNNRGFEGPIWPMAIITANAFLSPFGPSLVAIGGTFLAYRKQVATPVQYGISSINVYCYWGNTTIPYVGTSMTIGAPGFQYQANSDIWNNYAKSLIGSYASSGSTTTWMVLGSTQGGQTLMQGNAGFLANSNGYQPLGITFVTPTTPAPALTSYVSEVDFPAFYPRYLEIYQNRMFMAGFSAMPSIVAFSDTGEPEGYNPAWNFEVRTNDGDVVTCMKSYSTKLYIFKQHSFHILTGDNPNNFFLSEITNQYGCLNNRCAVVYDDILVFLDQKGVIMWNGASVTPLSTPKIQPILDSMNFAAAKTCACMVHDKLRNQILIAIPTGASTTNNITLVYDYLVGAWTTYNGFTPSVFAQAYGYNNTKNAFYGDTSGRVNWFGPSFLADNGAGYTTYIKSRFNHDQGDSSQKMFRRLFLNIDSPASSTLVFGVNFFQDYGSSNVLTPPWS